MNLIAVYASPDDPDAFDTAYFETHLPLLSQVPGLRRTTITRFTRGIMGEPFHMMAVMEFEDRAALKTGLNSPEMLAAGENLQSFASGLVTLMIGESEIQNWSLH